jgi:aspartate 1-decarboxylase
MREFLKSKIHGGQVTQADLAYEGSFGIDQEWMEEVGISPFEAIEVYNISNGARLKTYAIPFPRGSKQLQANGAAAHLVQVGHRVIIVSYAWLSENDLEKFYGPKILILNESNATVRFYKPDWRSV